MRKNSVLGRKLSYFGENSVQKGQNSVFQKNQKRKKRGKCPKIKPAAVGSRELPPSVTGAAVASSAGSWLGSSEMYGNSGYCRAIFSFRGRMILDFSSALVIISVLAEFLNSRFILSVSLLRIQIISHRMYLLIRLIE